MWWIPATFAQQPDLDPKTCDACDAWAAPHAPFRLYGDSWYVGPDGLSSVVVRTSGGLVLLDGTLPQSVAVIGANLDALGLELADVRYILVSHAHYDHAGGVAALQRLSGATVVTTAAGADALRAGTVLPDDPQAGEGADAMAFPPVVGPIETLADGATLTVGDVAFTLHATPGHTAGGATWTWQSCAGRRCADLVYADSLNAVASEGYRWSDGAGAALAGSIAAVRALPCDVLVPVHPGSTDLFERVTPRGARVDRGACRRYAAAAEARLRARLAEEDP